MRKKRETIWLAGKRLLSLLLTAALTVTLLPTTAFEAKAAPTPRASLSNPRMEEDFSMNARQKTTWDCVWFGRYPQSEVTVESNPSLYYKLEQEGWKTDEVTLNGTRYRKISGRFFQFDPVKWRVLETDGNTALLLSDVALDAKSYNTAYSAVTWEKSTMRSWLNGYDGTTNIQGTNYSKKNFIDAAFTGAEQAALVNTLVVNDDNIRYGTNGGNDTIDKLFLLSEAEVCMEDQAAVHGFVKNRSTEDEARRCKGSPYAKAVNSSVNDYWWLRSPGYNEDYAVDVGSAGRVSDCVIPNVTYIHGVRVALRLNLSSDLYSYAGTVSSAGNEKPSDPQPAAPAPTISKDATAEQIVNKMDTARLIDSVSLSAETIEGPSITIAGKKFSLFSLDGSLNLPFGDNVQAKVDEEKKQVQVLIGFDKFDGSAKLEAGENSSAYWSESYRQVKELYTGVTGKQVDTTALWNKFSKLRGKLKPMQGSIGLSASASAAGYMELSYAAGELRLSEGGVILEAALGMEQTYHLPPFPAVYVTFEARAGFNGTVRLVRQGVMRYTPAMEAAIGLDASLGAGVGSNKLKTYAEIGLQGKLDLGVKLPAASLSEALAARLSAYVYIESQVFGFKGPGYGPEKFADVQLYPNTKKARKARNLFDGADVAAFDWEEAELAARDYLAVAESQGSFPALATTGESGVSPSQPDRETSQSAQSRSASAEARAIASGVSFAKEGLYPYNAPQLAAFKDGRKLLVWVDDLGEKTGINKTSLLYALYDGQSWSSPQALAETGGANDYPALYSDGERAWLLWQKAQKLPETATLPELLSGVELYLSVWEDGSFGEAQPVTADNDRYEMLQCITAADGKIAVAWVENETNDPFQAKGANIVKVKECADGLWQERTLVSDQASVSNLHAAYVEGELALVYEAETDGVSSVWLVQGGRKRRFEGGSAELEQGVLYFNTEEGITAYDLAGGFREVLLPEVSGDFTVLSEGYDRMVVTTAYNGLASELTAYRFDQETGTWSGGVTMTDEGKYIRDYSLVSNGGGKLSAALNLVDVQEGKEAAYGAATLRVMDFGEEEDLIMGGVSYEGSLVTPGGALPLNFTVTNNGLRPVSGFTVELLDESGKVLQSGPVSCALAPGETAEASYIYHLSENLGRHKVTVKVYTEKETRREDNTTSIEVGYADLTLADLHLSGSGSQVRLQGRVQNLGFASAADATVTIYESTKDGTVIGSASLGTVAPQRDGTFAVAIPEVYMRVHPDLSGSVLYVLVQSGTEELNYGNNGESVLVQSAEDEPLVLNAQEMSLYPGDSQALEITCFREAGLSGQEQVWQSSDAKVATVEGGMVMAVAPGIARISVRVGGKEASCTILVTDGPSVAGVCLEESGIRLPVGAEKKLAAAVLPADAANRKLTWESSDPTVAAVGADGTVRGVSVGTALITVRSEDGGKTALCAVTVTLGEKQTCTASFAGGTGASGTGPSPITQKPGEMIILPDNTYKNDSRFFAGWSDGERIWKNGDAYRMPYHDVTFVAQWSEKATLTYPVIASAQAGGTIAPEGEVAVLQGQNQTFVITPEKGFTIKEVQVDGVSVGAAAEYTFQNVSEKHRITAVFEKVRPVQVQNIILDREAYTMKVGEDVLLRAVVLPEEAENKIVSWESSNGSIASVKDGLVAALAPGDAVITAKCVDGGEVSASCAVHVEAISGNTGNSQNPGSSGNDQDASGPGNGQNPGSTEDKQNPGASGNTQTPDGTGNPNGSGTKTPIKKLRTGAKITDSKTKTVYKILSLSAKTVEYVSCKSKKTSLKVPDVVRLGGKKFTVIAIAKGALKGNKKVKSLTIGTKVKTIGDKAFYGCKALKKITIKSKVLKKAGKSIFKGIHEMAKIRVPKAKLKVYRKLLKKKGQGKKVKIGN